jgi:non-homologous end joining protein Ku
MITQDAETGDELSRKDLVKGYEFKKDTYVVLSDEDFESARVEATGPIGTGIQRCPRRLTFADIEMRPSSV